MEYIYDYGSDFVLLLFVASVAMALQNSVVARCSRPNTDSKPQATIVDTIWYNVGPPR